MAHKRSSKKTSFGKKSDAEKAFVKKGRKSRAEDSADKPERKFRKSPGSSSDRYSNPDSRRTSRSDKPTFSKRGSFDKRSSDKPDRPFRKSSDESSSPSRRRTSSSDKPAFTKRGGFDKRSSDKPERPFRRSGDSDRPDSRKRYSDKPSFSRDKKRDDGERRPRRTGGDLGFVKRGKSFDKTPPKYTEAEKKDDGLTRLNKYIANSGMGSRREADEMIKLGLISVNGVTITEMGFKVKPGDVVRHEDKVLKSEKPVYVLLNKPKGFITTTVDPKERKTVMGLVASACKERIYPVGRLDRNTTGLLLLTNDGDLAEKLTHPSYKAKKIYQVELDKPLSKNDFQKIIDGVRLEEGKAMVDDLAIVSDDKKTIGIEIHIGWNRIVRRIFESLDYEVVKLDRVMYAGLDKKDLPRGEWRFLKPEEVVRLKHFK